MDITILLTLRGRDRHTLRWLDHHARIGLPAKVLVAEGEGKAEVKALLEQHRRFAGLDYEVIYYSDRQLSDYWFKLADAAARVQTRYVMMSDNDDFILPSGLRTTAEFLDAHPDYVSAGGHLAAVAIASPTAEQVHGAPWTYSLVPIDGIFDHDDAHARVRAHAECYSPFFYNVHRIEALRYLWDKTREIDFRYFDIWENYTGKTLLTKGKVRILPTVNYLRQVGTSQTAASKGSWLDNLATGHWHLELETYLGHLARELGPDAPETAGLIDDIRCKTWAGAVATAREQGRRPAPGPLEPLKAALRGVAMGCTPYCRHRARRKLDQMAADLRQRGADTEYCRTLKAELADVAATLTDPSRAGGLS